MSDRILGAFDVDSHNIRHAIRWADNYYGPDLSARFVDYLQSLDPDDQIRVQRPGNRDQPLHQIAKARTVRQQRGDIAKLDARLGKVRNIADARPEVFGRKARHGSQSTGDR